MAVPTQLSDLSATAASNSPAGSDTVGTTMDDYLRAIQSIIARISAGTDALSTPALGTPTAAGRISANAGLTVAGGTLVSRGITDSATATALTLSGSGANSVSIANSATSPTLSTTGGDLTLSSYTGIVKYNNNYEGVGYVWAHTNDATPAGGLASTGIFMGSSVMGIYFGSGVPTISALKGSLYLRTDGSTTNDRIYVCKTGGVADAASWTALITAS